MLVWLSLANIVSFLSIFLYFTAPIYSFYIVLKGNKEYLLLNIIENLKIDKYLKEN